MDYEKLKQFYNDEAMREAVLVFVINELNKEALNRAYGDGDTEPMKVARDILNKSFTAIETQFKPKEKQRNPQKGV